MPDTLPGKLQRVLADWPQWPVPEQPQLIRGFDDGENHDTYLLNCVEQELVLKIFREPHAGAIGTQQWAAGHDLAPTVVFADPQHGYMLMDFCVGDHQCHPRALGRALASMHNLAPGEVAEITGRFDLYYFHQRYLKDAGPAAHLMHEKLLPAFELYLADSTESCLCHNDLVVQNCFTLDQHSRFIDWEYAQLNNPWFDLASVIYYFRMNNQQKREFIAAYNQSWLTKLESDLFSAASCAFLWTDILWHLARGDEEAWFSQQQKLQDISSLARRLGISF